MACPLSIARTFPTESLLGRLEDGDLRAFNVFLCPSPRTRLVSRRQTRCRGGCELLAVVWATLLASNRHFSLYDLRFGLQPICWRDRVGLGMRRPRNGRPPRHQRDLRARHAHPPRRKASAGYCIRSGVKVKRMAANDASVLGASVMPNRRLRRRDRPDGGSTAIGGPTPGVWCPVKQETEAAERAPRVSQAISRPAPDRLVGALLEPPVTNALVRGEFARFLVQRIASHLNLRWWQSLRV